MRGMPDMYDMSLRHMSCKKARRLKAYDMSDMYDMCFMFIMEDCDEQL